MRTATEQPSDTLADITRMGAGRDTADRRLVVVPPLGEDDRLQARPASETDPLAAIVGNSDETQRVRTLIRMVANSTATVLITGPSGAGKELVARALHDISPRRARPFVAVNSSALTDTLLASELFGHRRGAFTGASNDTKGLFELADGGTLFLDEIGDASAGLQAALLRVIEEGAIRPIGEAKPRPVRVRIVAATNCDLETAVKAGRFRADLMYRLRVFPIHVPPLSERRGDIPLLVHHFLKRHAASSQRAAPDVSAAAMAHLRDRAYPGNVRELSNLLERALLLSEPGAPIAPCHLADFASASPRDEERSDALPPSSLKEATERVERQVIADALARNAGNRAGTARELRISKRWLIRKIAQYGLRGAQGLGAFRVLEPA